MQKKFYIWSITLITLLFSLYSCNDENTEPYFRLRTLDGETVSKNLSIGAGRMTKSFAVESNSVWKVVLSDNTSPWVSIYPDYGKGDGTFNILIEENTSNSLREVQLQCTVNGRVLSTVKINQSGYNPNFTITPASIDEISYTGDEIKFTINSDTEEWSYSISDIEDNWLTEKQKDATTLVLEASVNTTAKKRTATVTFTHPSLPNATQYITIRQAETGGETAPIADLLDVVFNADGTAEDISSLRNQISTIEGSQLSTLFSNTYQRYMARFNHSPGGTSSTGFYRVDYSSKQTVKDGLADGHTLEAMFMLDVDAPLPDSEIKMFSSHQGGGTGLMVGNNSRNNSIIFLPHVGSGYVWTNSNIVPERGKYYHVVGIWNKSENKSQIYVNGVLKATVTTSGDFNLPSATWFAVGGDASSSSDVEMGWKGDVTITRIYNKPLNAEEVGKLWKQVENLVPSPTDIQLSKVLLPSKSVKLSGSYTINGEGFVAGDKIRMTPLSGSGSEYTCDGTASGNSLSLTIPAGFVTGKYRFFVVRGSKTLDIGFATLTVVENLPDAAKVIAHRGYWTAGAPQNSVAALVAAQALNIYGAEFDVWITTDGKVVLSHDATINNITIENATYSQIKDITLSNGEKLPTLEDYLTQGKKDTSTKLILEIKSHSNTTNNDRAVTAAVNAVKNANMTGQVEYIAFSLDVCKKILALQPDAIVAYLEGDRTPQELHNLGIKGIDYSLSVLRNNKSWITQAQNLGMTVNVWTVNGESDLQEMIDQGVNYITTDYPVLAKSLIGNN